MVDIEPERPDDADAITTVLRAAFETDDEAALVTVLREERDLRRGCSMVAHDDGVVGYAGVSDATLTGHPDVVLAVLGPVAVAPERQGEGVGSALVREAMRACVRTGADAVVLEGDPAFYGQFGFEPAADFGLESDLSPPEGAFQAWPCFPEALADIEGEVRHPAPFHAL